MTALSKMYHDVRAQGIVLFVYDIGFSDAATLEIDGDYAIFLDFSMYPSIASYKEALAHELGHCCTGCTHTLSSPYDLIAKHEYKADRWAFEHYLPFDELCTAVRYGLTQPWQIAEWMDFPEAYVRRAIAYYTQTRGLRFDVSV